MYAVIETGGKQYRVTPGDSLQVETLPGDVGSEIELGHVVAVVGDDQQLLTGDSVASAPPRSWFSNSSGKSSISAPSGTGRTSPR